MIRPTLTLGKVPPAKPEQRITITDKNGLAVVPPDNSAEIYAAVNQTAAGCYISIWSLKARVWVRCLNRYGTINAAEKAIDGYGFTLWTMSHPPHARDQQGRSR